MTIRYLGTISLIRSTMIKNIRLENFMAHQATSIDLSPGVTVITGPNNIGKSAIVEAIRYLVYNPAPKNVIRHGAKQALVRLELDSGEIITWQRQDKNASYTIQQPGQEPEEYHKFGRDVPGDVRALLRLEKVETDTGKSRHPPGQPAATHLSPGPARIACRRFFRSVHGSRLSVENAAGPEGSD